ncbi:MAG: TIGR00341 family protein [Rhodobacteraceae bacterium]|nr:TIGR00341 family protein [Paracoccaceae bacterium]
MTLCLVVVSAPRPRVDRLVALAGEHDVTDIRVHDETQAPDRATIGLLAGQGSRQELIDALQSLLEAEDDWRITLLPVDTTVPYPESEEERDSAAESERKEREARSIGGRTREEIYDSVWSQANIDRNYLVFVVLSTVVASLGMVENNVAVVVGAMVIAPLLGPNLAFAVGVALGDERLMLRAALTNLAGLALVLVLGFFLALVVPIDPEAGELAARTRVGFDGIAIALASGMAAALSMVTGLSSALVGVMVAVALLPPTVAVGIYLGLGLPGPASGAALLVSVNIVCVNLAAQIVMISRGIRPRTWYEKKGARKATIINATVWFSLLVALAALLWIRAPEIV